MRKRTRTIVIGAVTTAALLASVTGAVLWFAYDSEVSTIENTWNNPVPKVPTVTPVPTPPPTSGTGGNVSDPNVPLGSADEVVETPPTGGNSLTGTPTVTPTTPEAPPQSPVPVSPHGRVPGGVTVLVIGTDDRSTSVNAELGGYYDGRGARSDTLLLTHLYPDGSLTDVVSIPRDTMVSISSSQACPQPGSWVRVNTAFTIGGAECTAETIANLTGEPIDHAITVDFTSAVNVVQTLGGLEVCLTTAVNDKDSGAFLPAGQQKLTGEQALSLMRARKTLGNGSDLGRTDRQRFLLTELKNQTLQKLEREPMYTLNLVNIVVDAVRTDNNLTPDTIVGLLERVLTQPPTIASYMLPVVTNPANPNTVLYNKQGGDNIFSHWHTAKTKTPNLVGLEGSVQPPSPFCSR